MWEFFIGKFFNYGKMVIGKFPVFYLMVRYFKVLFSFLECLILNTKYFYTYKTKQTYEGV